ncbi:MAG: DUF427 domain-containing protein [Alphaproteobacteria bacterium]
MTSQTPGSYRLAVEPVDGTVVAKHGQHVLARSGAARVIRETRWPVQYYFPPGDVNQSVLRPSDYKTFCPFKGTATYFDIVLPDKTIEAGAWTYGKARDETATVAGHIGFFDTVADLIECDRPLPEPTDDGHVGGALVDWLLREAWACAEPAELTAELGRRMVAEGIPAARLNVTVWSLHPLLVGTTYVWQRDGDVVSVDSAHHEDLDRPEYQNSPLRHVMNGLGGVRQSLATDDAEFSFPIMADLKARGMTDYVAMALVFSDGRHNVMTLATDEPGGFTTAQLGLTFECSFVIARLFEALIGRANAATVMDTYLGRRTGQRVLGGEIRRGDGEDLDAALLYCDLRHSTTLAERLPRDAFLALLNRFFEAAADPIAGRGGEVLKFIGDAVLAIFPADNGAEMACAAARAAADEIVAAVAAIEPPGDDLPPIACAIGLHYGSVTYGNVGARDRLDFTVIGPAANIAVRLSDFGKQIDQPVVMSAVACGDTAEAEALGEAELRHVARPMPVFVPPQRGDRRGVA